MLSWITFASLGTFVVYDCAAAFYIASIDKPMVVGYGVPCDGFASACSKGRGTSCHTALKGLNSQYSGLLCYLLQTMYIEVHLSIPIVFYYECMHTIII